MGVLKASCGAVEAKTNTGEFPSAVATSELTAAVRSSGNKPGLPQVVIELLGPFGVWPWTVPTVTHLYGLLTSPKALRIVLLCSLFCCQLDCLPGYAYENKVIIVALV